LKLNTLVRRVVLAAAAAMSTLGMPAQASPDTSVNNKQGFNTDVIYQIVTDRFFDGDATNNPAGSAFSAGCTQKKLYCGGDWKGIQAKIASGYLTGMGITAIWISPTVDNITTLINYDGVDNTAYHGYWARDFKKPNLRFGSMTDFSNMIAAAHAANIKVIIDFAPNHSSPTTVDGEDGALYDNGLLLGSYNNDPNGIFHHNGGTKFENLESGTYKNLYDLADINQNNSSIDLYLKAAIKVWLDLGIDGIRYDAVKHMPFGWQKSLMSYVDGYKPVFSFGEWSEGTGESDPANHYFANRSGMSVLDFEFARMVNQVFGDGSADMNALNAMITSTGANYATVNDQVTFIDNHDMPRFQTAGANHRKLEQALAFTLTSRGVPAVYYGTEQYMTGTGDPDNRSMMSSFSTTSTAYKLIARLAPLRKSNPAIAYGSTTQRWVNSNVYIYERKLESFTIGGANAALIAINRDLVNATNITGLVTSLPPGTYTDVLSGLGLNGNSIVVGANGAVSNFTLAPGAIAVWQAISTTWPVVTHIGPLLGKAGNTVTLDGRNFGATKGSMFFGSTQLSGATITSWEDTQIKFTVPALTAGMYPIQIHTYPGASSPNYGTSFELLSGPQVTVRFVVKNAFTAPGENISLSGDNFEMTNWSDATPLGPLFNQVEYQYPDWYTDVNVPANTTINFKFIRKGPGMPAWEGGSNHSFISPASGTATVIVNWQP
jgi:glycosidase